MRRAAKVDQNQQAIVDALRDVGCAVTSLAAVGKGCPDLLVGFRGRNILLEVKNGAMAPSARKLTPDQELWHAAWRGQIHVVTSVADALVAIGVVR